MLRTMLFAAFVLAAPVAWSQEQEPAPEETKSEAMSPVERGRYLVHDVAMCVICHTPKTEDGAIITSQLLRGAPMPVSSPYRRQTWAFRAPSIAGLGGFPETEIVTLLQTGSRPNGDRPLPPMPPFRMTEEDARAVAAYLKSLR